LSGPGKYLPSAAAVGAAGAAGQKSRATAVSFHCGFFLHQQQQYALCNLTRTIKVVTGTGIHNHLNSTFVWPVGPDNFCFVLYQPNPDIIKDNS